MENKPQATHTVLGVSTPLGATSIAGTPVLPQPKLPRLRKRIPKSIRKIIFVVILVLLIIAGAVAAFFTQPKQQISQSASSRFNTTEIPLDSLGNDQSEIIGTQSVAINGPLLANDTFTISPSGQPTRATAGQIYYDQTSNQLAYYNGSQFVQVGSQLNTGDGITNINNILANTGVLSLQGQAGNVTLTAGSGIVISGTTLTNTGIIGATAGTGITVTNDGSGNITIANTNTNTGTVNSLGGTVGRLAKFTGVQTIADSLMSESGSTVTVNGGLTVTSSLTASGGLAVTGNITATGDLTLGTALTIGNGGTGATSLTNNGVVVAHGTGALTAVASGAAGECLISTAGAPAFTACPGGGGVTTLNSLTGALTVANATAGGSTITIDDASTSAKGIARFNATNFSAAAGVINTIQGISTAASPTFVGLTLTGDIAVNGGDITSTGALNVTPSGALVVGATGQTLTLQGSVTTITSTGAGNDVIVNSADTIELQDNTNVTGNLDASGTLNAGTADAFQVATNGNIVSAGNATLQGGLLTIGTNSQAGSTALYDGSSNTGTLQATALGANRVYTLPDEDGTVCLSTGNCAGAGTTLQAAYNNSTSPEITLDTTRGALTIRDNATPIGANLFEIQNSGGGTTYLAVTTSGLSVTGTSTATGNINSSGGALQTNGTTRIDNSGNASNIGTISLSGSISGGTTISGSGNINTSAGALQTAGTSRVDVSGNLVNIGNLTATGAITVASVGAGNDVIIDGADQFIVQDAAVFNGTGTFNTDVDLTLAETENLNITNTVTGTNSVNLISAIVTNNTTSGTQQVALLQNAAGSGTTEGLLVLDNADTDTATTNGLQITSAAGGITTALDVSDPDIVTALLFGLNDITGTNFSVTGSTGSFTSAGNATLQGGTITAGTTSQAGSLVISDGSSNTGTLQVTALGSDRTYTFPDATGTICLSTGNCAGSGTGVTSAIGGSANRLAKFTAGQNIENSTITDNGTTVSTTVDVIIQGGDLTVGTTSQPASLLLHDGNGQTTTLQPGDSSGNLTFILPTTAGSTNQCLKQSGTGNQLTWDSCDGGGGGVSTTLQNAYTNGNSITTSDARDIDIVLADTTTDSNLDIVVADGSSSFVSVSRANGTGTADPAQLLLIDNLDLTRSVNVGIKVQAAAGGIVTALDLTDSDIVTAISVGINDITGTTGNIDFSNFDVVGSTGSITTAGDIAVNGGDITSSGALNITPGGALAVGATGQTLTLQGSTTSITSTGAGNDITLTSADQIILNSGGTIELQDATNITGALSASGAITATTLGSADSVTYVCRNAANQLAICQTTATGSAFVQGGNSFGATATLGTNDANDLAIERNNSTQLTIGNGVVTFASNADLTLSGATAYISNTQDGLRNEVFGTGTNAVGDDIVIVGYNSTAGDRSVSIGASVVNGGNDTVTIGRGAVTNSAAAISIGSGSTAAGESIALGTGASADFANSITIGAYSANTAVNQLVIGSNDDITHHISQVVIGSGVTDTTPNSFTLQGTSGSGSNIAGASATFAGGQGTGTGNGGSLNFQIAKPGSTGASLNGLTTIMSVSGSTGAVTITNTPTTTFALDVDAGSGVTSGGGLRVSGTGTSAIANGLVQITHSGAYTSTGGLLNVGASGTTTGTVASLSASNSSQTTNTILNVAQTGVSTGYTGNVATFTSTSTTGASNVLNVTNNVINGTGTGVNINSSTTGALTNGLLRVNASAAHTGTAAAIVTGTTSGTGLTITASSSTSGTALSIGANTGTAINVTSGLTTLTAPTSGSGTAFSVTNSTSTGNIAVFSDNATAVLTLADGGNITVGTSNTTGSLLILDTKTDAGDPTGVDGGMYYNSSMAMMRCYTDGKWRGCNDHGSMAYNFELREDFLNSDYLTASQYIGTNHWIQDFSGTGSGIDGTFTSIARRSGVVQLYPGTGTSGYSAIYLNAMGSEFEPLSGGEEVEFAINIPTLADGTNDFNVIAGFCDNSSGVDCTDGVYIEYDRDTSVNWRFATANGGTRTKTSSSTAVATGWHYFKIVVNSNATSIQFYMDGASLGSPITTNIPTATNQPEFMITKDTTTGTAGRYLYVDYFQWRNTFTTRR